MELEVVGAIPVLVTKTAARTFAMSFFSLSAIERTGICGMCGRLSGLWTLWKVGLDTKISADVRDDCLSVITSRTSSCILCIKDCLNL